MKTVAVIGGGPAGLMAAEVLSQSKLSVAVYEAKSSLGRKFLIAGKGGLNLTHSEPLEAFLSRFGARADVIRPLLKEFGPEQVREWVHAFGIETFVGPSGRVFPSDMKALPILKKWTQRLVDNGVTIHKQHRWLGWNADESLRFSIPAGDISVRADAVVLTLGGASWPKLGSDGLWVSLLQEVDIEVNKLQPSNSGFDILLSEHFRSRYAGEPLKSVVLKFTNSRGETFDRQGSCTMTKNGIEGSLIYAASAMLRDEINSQGSATVYLDLAPDRSEDQLLQRLSQAQGSRSFASHLRSKANIKGVEAGMMREFAAEAMSEPARTAHAIKHLPVTLTAARPIAEAISTAGGVTFESLDDHLMVKSRPGLFCAGEMLDWEAPTGGYLLTATLASGRVAGKGVIDWLSR